MSCFEIEKDIEEVERLRSQTSRPEVITLLTNNISILDTRLKKAKDSLSSQTAAEVKPGSGDQREHTMEGRQSLNSSQVKTTESTGPYIKTIKSYAWDQSEKFLKIYVDIPGVHTIAKEKVTCTFNESSYHLVVSELNSFSYTQQVTRLLHPIAPSSSYIKIKTDSVLVMLRKVNDGLTWSHVTQAEKHFKDLKEKKKPEIDKNTDPQDSLMGLLKGMYDDGDDEMKRTIKKAFYESRLKQSKDPDAVPEMPPI